MTNWPLFGGLLALTVGVTAWVAWLTRDIQFPGDEQMSTTEQETETRPWMDRWRTAVAAAEADPSPENFGTLDALRREHILAEGGLSAARRGSWPRSPTSWATPG